MSNVKITNKHDALLNVAGIDVRPKASVAVDSEVYAKWKLGSAAKVWLAKGLIVEGAAAKDPEGDEPKGTDEPAKTRDRKELLSAAKELKLEHAPNISNADLLKLVTEAEAKA